MIWSMFCIVWSFIGCFGVGSLLILGVLLVRYYFWMVLWRMWLGMNFLFWRVWFVVGYVLWFIFSYFLIFMWLYVMLVFRVMGFVMMFKWMGYLKFVGICRGRCVWMGFSSVCCGNFGLYGLSVVMEVFNVIFRLMKEKFKFIV